jgi:hypothetical protein
MSGENKLESGSGLNLADNLASNLGVFSIKPIAKYLSGARCTLKVGGRIIGFAFSVSWTVETKVTEILTIDNYEPHELAPSRIDVHGSISGFRIPGSGPGQLYMQSDVLNFLHQPYIEIEVRDSQTDEIIFMTKRAMITNRQEAIKTNSLAELTLQFKAIGFRDELTPEPPKEPPKTL